MNTFWRHFRLALVLLGIALSSGCGAVIGVQRSLLEQEMRSGPADLAALDKQQQQLDAQISAVEKSLTATQKEQRAAQADSALFEQRRSALQAEGDRLQTLCRQQDAVLGVAGGPATAPAGLARDEIQDLTARLARLEDWLVYEHTQLRDRPTQESTKALRSRLRREAYLLAVAQTLQNANLPAWPRSFEEDASLQPVVTAADIVSSSSTSVCRTISSWADRDHPSLTLSNCANGLTTAQKYALETAGKLKASKNVAAQAAAERYAAVAEVLTLAQSVAAAEEAGDANRQPNRIKSTRALMELWRAVTAASDGERRNASAAILRAVALADYALSDSFSSQDYLTGRIQAVAEQRSAMVALVIELPPAVQKMSYALISGGFLGVGPDAKISDKQPGVLLALIAPDSPAAAAGFKVGDRITHWDGLPVADYNVLLRLCAASKPGEKVKLTYQRGAEANLEKEVELAQRPG
jgi:hypothetical protein